MPPADRRRLLDSPRLPQVVAFALSLQLVAAAGAVGGLWSVASVAGPPTVPAAALAAPATVPALPAPALPRSAVRLAADGLWTGAVEAAPLGVDDAGALEVPATASEIGWWQDGARPGTAGAAVVVGHVDLRGRTGVFGSLADARPGTVIRVWPGDGTLVRFRVTRVDSFPKDAFPTDLVYGPTEQAVLRLVTCGGRFDRSTGHYEDNVVVQAVAERSGSSPNRHTLYGLTRSQSGR